MIEPVPVMRIVKKKVDTPDSGAEKFVEPKVEIPAIAKEDFDEKSIASDTELMKILEEDSTHSEETKVECKKEETKNSNGDLDAALEKNKTPGEIENDVAATDIKKEETSGEYFFNNRRNVSTTFSFSLSHSHLDRLNDEFSLRPKKFLFFVISILLEFDFLLAR